MKNLFKYFLPFLLVIPLVLQIGSFSVRDTYGASFQGEHGSSFQGGRAKIQGFSLFDFYVDQTGGNDSNDGKIPARAWQTIVKVNAQSFSAGNKIGFKRGESWREQLTVPSSGSSSAPILFGAYGVGLKPEINGSIILTGFTLDTGSIYLKTGYTGFANMVWEDGTRLVERGSKAAIVGSGEFFVDTVADEIYIRSTDDADPDTHTIEAGDKVNCINVTSKNWIIIQDLYLTKGRGVGLSNLYLNAASNTIIQRVEIQQTANQAYGIRIDTPTNITIRNNKIHEISNSGMYFRLNGSGVTVQNNEIFDIGLFDIGGDRSGIAVGSAGGNHITGPILIERNLVFNLNPATQINGMSQPILVDQSDDSIIRFNIIHDHNKGGIVVSGDRTSGNGHINKTQIHYNLIYNQNLNELTQTGTQNTIYVNNVEDSEVYNNTIHNVHMVAGFGAAILHVGQTGDTLASGKVKNNIISEVVGSGAFHVQHRENATFTAFESDNNQFFDSIGYIYKDGASPDETSLADFVAASPFEDNSKESDPLFTVAGSDFTLQTGSPAIDNGLDVGLTTDILGNPVGASPDVGAYEK